MRERPNLKAVSDDSLLRGLFDVLRQTRHDEANLIAHIAEVDARRLYAREASPSMFAWCTERLDLSEQEAYLRITVARASREHPGLLTVLRDGRLGLSSIARLVPHLTPENRDAVLKRAAGMSYRQIKELVVELKPQPDVPAKIRTLPVRSATSTTTTTPQLCAPRVEAPTIGPSPAGERSFGGGPESGPVLQAPPVPVKPVPRASMEPLAPARFKVQFTADAEFKDELERLQALVRSSVPDGDLGKVIRLAVTRELKRLEAKRFGKVKNPRKRLGKTDTRAKSRHIPAPVRRFVEKRDGGRCTYSNKHGRRCTKRHDLEFHHVRPFGRGGDHSPEGIVLMCRTHNQLLAEQEYGREKMTRHRRRAGAHPPPG
jgi:hypothetical protein